MLEAFINKNRHLEQNDQTGAPPDDQEIIFSLMNAVLNTNL